MTKRKLNSYKGFLVINTKHILQDKNNIPLEVINFLESLEKIQHLLPNNQYWVVNKDEPYSNEVYKLIKEGELQKKKDDSSILLNRKYAETIKVR